MLKVKFIQVEEWNKMTSISFQLLVLCSVSRYNDLHNFIKPKKLFYLRAAIIEAVTEVVCDLIEHFRYVNCQPI